MARRDVVVQEEEEDLEIAMQKLPIPFNELGHLPIDLDFGFSDAEDSNLLFEEPSHNNLKPFQTFPNQQTATRSRFNAPKRSRNKRGRRKRRCFKSAACLFDSKADNTNKSCSHCGTSKTPLWREGPKGAGTLCNACGMRYRLGRLLPEYHPASSPGFKPNVHSNFHRKVMEIRKERNSPSNSF